MFDVNTFFKKKKKNVKKNFCCCKNDHLNIRFLSTYFRDEVDILAVKVIQTTDERQLKYGN